MGKIWYIIAKGLKATTVGKIMFLVPQVVTLNISLPVLMDPHQIEGNIIVDFIKCVWALQAEAALERRQLQIMTIVAATAILPIKRHLILTKINTDLKETNTQGMWSQNFRKKYLFFCKKIPKNY